MKAVPTKRRIFVECTYTYLSGGSGGIRRVARNLANLGPDVSDESFDIRPIVWGGVGFFAPKRQLNEQPHPAVRLMRAAYSVRRRVMDRVNAMGAGLCSIAGQRLGNRMKSAYRACATWLLGLLGERSSKPGRDEMLYLLFGILTAPLGSLFVSRVKFRPGDIVVLVDSTWNSERMLANLTAAQETPGIKLGVMVHDIFPLTIPEMCHADTVAGYRRWFSIIAPEANFFITNSESTRKALETYLCEHPQLRAKTLQAASFPLGADLDQARCSSADTSQMRMSLRDLPGCVILAVGTIEPRKNYAAILDAFDLLSPQYPVSLVIVGRQGWKGQDVLDRIAAHPLLGTRLLHLDNASDGELAEAFTRSDCLVCASWAEGFGLPVVEGLMHGVRVFASDIAVFHEAGGTSCRYFPPDDPGKLAELIGSIVTGPPQTKASPSANAPTWIDWEESTRRFAARVVELAAR